MKSRKVTFTSQRSNQQKHFYLCQVPCQVLQPGFVWESKPPVPEVQARKAILGNAERVSRASSFKESPGIPGLVLV